MKVKMLAVLALVLLVSSASEGRILSKCELKSQLEAALGGNQGGNGPATVTNGPGSVTGPGNVTVPGNVSVPGNVTVPGNVSVPGNVTVPGNVSVPGNVTVPGNVSVPGNVTVPGNVSVPGNVTVPGNRPTTVPGNTTANSLIAQIVCSVERVSRFDTRLVTTIQEDPRPPVRPPVIPPLRPQQRPNERPGGRPGRPGERPGRPGGRGKRSHVAALRRPNDDSSSSESSESSEENVTVTTRLLGIFQLSDRVACDSGSGQSLNICRMNCRALTDDDIRDDIACLKTLLDATRNAVVSGFASPPNNKQLAILSVNECRNVNPAQYFAECR